ncbi:MAG TPA: PadR family transcriptional regulator [Thermoplasmata archaeon]|nr:PadR family transcriptional regulator [Thermoplasmata archaeon]
MFGFGGHEHKRGLRQCVLLLLARNPRNGAELIDDIEHWTHGRWRPSPGSVYPLLEELTGAGMIQKGSDGRYGVTARARSEQSWFRGWIATPRTPGEVLSELSGYVSYLEDVSRTAARNDWSRLSDELRSLALRLEALAK